MLSLPKAPEHLPQDSSHADVFNLPQNQLNSQQVYQGQANLQGFHQVLGQSHIQV